MEGEFYENLFHRFQLFCAERERERLLNLNFYTPVLPSFPPPPQTTLHSWRKKLFFYILQQGERVGGDVVLGYGERERQNEVGTEI